MKADQKINLICRMAGNIFSGGDSTQEESVGHALEIFDWAEKHISKNDGQPRNKLKHTFSYDAQYGQNMCHPSCAACALEKS